MFKILFIAEQPWQIEVAAIIASNLKNMQPNFEIMIAATDYYTFLHEPAHIVNCEDKYNTKIKTLSKLYQEWQQDYEPNIEVIDQQIKSWATNIKLSRNIDIIEKTNQLIFGWERTYYFLPITDAWRKKILLDSIIWAENAIENFTPALVISIERNTLINNLVYEIASHQKIPHLTFIQSRIENRWILHKNFGLGILANQKTIYKFRNGQFTDPQFELQFIEKLKVGKKLYSSLSSSLSDIFNLSFLQKIPYIFGREISPYVPTITKLLKMSYLRVRLGKARFPYKVVRLEENLFRLTLFEFRQIIFYKLRIFGVKFWGTTKRLDQKYFIWALHSRPEDSTSVLGLGMDELVEIKKIIRLLPDGTTLAVKEHPAMFGLRQRKFYSELKTLSRVRLVDAFVNTEQILLDSKCLGSVGISGTILLESELIGKPSFALGIPEFKEYLSTSRDDIQQYFYKVINKEYTNVGEQAIAYIRTVVQNSSVLDLPYLSDLKADQTQDMLKRWAYMIVAFYNENY